MNYLFKKMVCFIPPSNCGDIGGPIGFKVCERNLEAVVKLLLILNNSAHLKSTIYWLQHSLSPHGIGIVNNESFYGRDHQVKQHKEKATEISFCLLSQ